ncbi:tricin synthase 1-like isoform X2 [Argentina anserina]|uniref:tricin synthase 1-like isoform X2 n=1 Tax=Argentina anserina TaxID=57926 RepID=UPI0021767B6D|nr:tricin synthase 1-like isoform X2 [Potentilla anserina]
MGSTSVGLYRWPTFARQRVTLPQKSAQPRLKFDSFSSGKFHSGGIGYGGCRIKLKTSISVRASNAFVVADDKAYGNKQIISINPRLYDYILENVREPEVLRQLGEETASMRGSMMQVSPDQAQLLAMLVQIHGAEKCIEVGVYTGYSSLAIALVLPESGRLVACDRDIRCLEVANKYYEKANVSHKANCCWEYQVPIGDGMTICRKR